MGKKSRSESGLNVPDHISESLKTIFWVKLKILKFFDADQDPDPGIRNLFNPGSGIFLTLDLGWKNSDPGYRINIPDPQHWYGTYLLTLAR